MALNLNLGNAVRSAADKAVQSRATDGLLPPGQGVEIDRGSQAGMGALVLRGFAPLEDDGVWSEGSTSEIDVRMRAVKADRRYRLILGVSPLELGSHRASVSIRVNGGKTHRITRSESGWQDVEVDFQLGMVGRSPGLVIKFEVSNPASPATLGAGEDTRQLGFKLRSLKVIDTGKAGRASAEVVEHLRKAASAAESAQPSRSLTQSLRVTVHALADRGPIWRAVLLDKNPLIRLMRWMRFVSRTVRTSDEKINEICHEQERHARDMLGRMEDMERSVLRLIATHEEVSSELISMPGSAAVALQDLLDLMISAQQKLDESAAMEARALDVLTAAHRKLDDYQTKMEALPATVSSLLPNTAHAHSNRVLRTRRGWLISTGFGAFSCDEQDDLLAMCLAEWGDVEKGLRLFLQETLRAGDVFVDVGANIGLHTVVAAGQVGPSGRVFAIEALPRTVSHLRTSLRLSGVEDIVDVLEVAAGAADAEQVHFNVAAVAGHSSLYALNEEVTEQISIPVRALDGLIPHSPVRLVKIDVEGAELDVIHGMRSVIEANPELGIIAEYAHSHLHRVGTTPEQWEQVRAEYGFDLYRIDDLTGACGRVERFQDLSQLVSSNVLLCRGDWAGRTISSSAAAS